jgi:AraC family cel operon transcriptional repressor
MIRPDDTHTFTSRQGITIMNVAFPLTTLRHLERRYFADSSSFFWSADPLPFQASIGMSEVRMFSKRAGEVWPYRHSALHLDSFLLMIFRWLLENKNLAVKEDTPAWLNSALHNFSTPELFKQGPAGFADLCEKHIDHVNRIVRKSFDKTLSDLVTELRMNFAARQLSLTNVPIKLICRDCGLTNLGHFYKTFRSYYHQTPSQYREASQTIV